METTSWDASDLLSSSQKTCPNIPDVKGDYNGNSLPSEKWNIRTIHVSKELTKVQRDQGVRRDRTSKWKENHIWSLCLLHTAHVAALSSARECMESWVRALKALVKNFQKYLEEVKSYIWGVLEDVSTNRCVHLLKRPLNYSIASTPKRHEH